MGTNKMNGGSGNQAASSQKTIRAIFGRFKNARRCETRPAKLVTKHNRKILYNTKNIQKHNSKRKPAVSLNRMNDGGKPQMQPKKSKKPITQPTNPPEGT